MRDETVLYGFIKKHPWLSSWYVSILCRYCRQYTKKYEMPVGRPIAKFMMWFNKNHSDEIFSREAINWYYTY